MLSTTVTPDQVGIALGQDAPTGTLAAQWQMWITDAVMLISSRVDSITPPPTIDQAKLDYVVREAVVAQVRRPDAATQVTVSVDDGSTSKTYARGTGRVAILDDWWEFLGLAGQSGAPYSIDTTTSGTYHRDICALTFGALYCSCGADIAGIPLWEG